MIKRSIIDGDRIVYQLDGDWHRPNGPASIWNEFTWYWYLYGNNHRYYGPASNWGGWFIHGIRLKRR